MIRRLPLFYLRLKTDRRAQDMIEYALLAGFLSLIAFGMFPSSYVPALTHIWERVGEVMCTLTGTCSS